MQLIRIERESNDRIAFNSATDLYVCYWIKEYKIEKEKKEDSIDEKNYLGKEGGIAWRTTDFTQVEDV